MAPTFAARAAVGLALAGVVIVTGFSGRVSVAGGGDKPNPSVTSDRADGSANLRVPTRPVADCVVIDAFFAREVWPKIAERTGPNCHSPVGDAAETRFVLARPEGTGAHEAMEHNVRAFASMARAKVGRSSRLLFKATSGLDHGGGPALKPTSTAYRILDRFVRRVNGDPTGALPRPPSPSRRRTSKA